MHLMDKPTASRILRTLQDRNLVSAEPDPSHRRRVLYRLEPAGQQLVESLLSFRQYMREGMELGIAAEERAQLRVLLGSVMDNLDRMETEISDPVFGK